MDYGKATKILRAVAGLEQRELADIAGVDPSLISMIESGKRKPSLSTLEQITRAFKIPQHLFALLAAGPDDLSTSHPEELQRAVESLARVLLTNASKQKTRRGSRKKRTA